MCKVGPASGYRYREVVIDAALFGKALVIGFSVAAPIGPVGVLCFRRSVERGWRAGVATGIGAASAETIHAGIAVFGLAAAFGSAASNIPWLDLVSGLLLLVFGVYIALCQTKTRSTERPVPSFGRHFGDGLSAFAISVTNPLTPIAFAALFAGIGLVGLNGGVADGGTRGTTLVGVFIGAWLWFVALTAAATVLHRRLDPSAIRWINRVSGAAVALFGLYLLIA
ncbi:MAG: LysE family translocator [Alphaproteobacteria bacterium]